MKKKVIILTGLFVLSGVLFGWGIWNYSINKIGQSPVIEAENSVLSISVKANTTEYLQGIHATDFEDGDLDDSIYIDSISNLSSSDTADIRYIVFDSNNNCAELTRTVQYTDYTEPTFQLIQKLVIPVSSEIPDFSEYIAATDALDGDISNSITLVDTDINSYTPGQYTATFAVKNNRDEEQQISLPVIIYNTEENIPTIELKDYITYIAANSEMDLSSYVSQVTDSSGNIIPYTFDEEEYRNQGTALITVEPNIDLSTPGTYYATYTVIDIEGNSSNCILTAVVR